MGVYCTLVYPFLIQIFMKTIYLINIEQCLNLFVVYKFYQGKKIIFSYNQAEIDLENSLAHFIVPTFFRIK